MSKLRHNAHRILNPAFNLTYDFMEAKDVKVHTGVNCTEKMADAVKAVGGSKPVIVTDKFLVKIGVINTMIKSLEDAGIDYYVYDGVLAEPTTDAINSAIQEIVKAKCDCVISVGGGSAIDFSKVVCGLAKNPEVRNYIGLTKMLKFSVKKGTYPIISVPTTAGTGAEVTVGAVVKDSSTGQKGLVVNKKFTAKHVFLEPNLTTSLPNHITTSTGFDALTHAVEAYVSKFSTEKSRKNSVDAIQGLFKYMPLCMEDPKDINARQELLIASNKAGFAIGRAHIGTVHSIGHNAGSIFHMPHGLVIGVLLPHVLELYLGKSDKKLAELAQAIGVANSKNNDRENAVKFIDAIRKLMKKVEFPNKLENIDSSKFAEIARLAENESYLYPIPKYVSRNEITEVLKKIDG